MNESAIVVDATETRYDRQERITWWDQGALARSSVLVVGAGALGSEIVKNLVLVGVGAIAVVDMDHIEHTNLSRCVFFRDGDIGQSKAALLAERAGQANPEVHVTGYTSRVERLGIGFLREFDVVIAGLDNREARRWINQACRKLGKTWIDGAIEGLQGLARVFGPEGVCYECTLGEADLLAMEQRRSCALLTAEEVAQGRTATTASTSSVVAGIECQEAIKLLVGRPDLLALTGKAWVVSGETMLSYITAYQEDPYCLAHDAFQTWGESAEVKSLSDLLHDRSGVVAIDLEDDLVTIEGCAACDGGGLTAFRSSLQSGAAACEQCGQMRAMTTRTSLEPTDPAVLAEWSSFSPPLVDVVTLRTHSARVHIPVRRGEDADS